YTTLLRSESVTVFYKNGSLETVLAPAYLPLTTTDHSKSSNPHHFLTFSLAPYSCVDIVPFVSVFYFRVFSYCFEMIHPLSYHHLSHPKNFQHYLLVYVSILHIRTFSGVHSVFFLISIPYYLYKGRGMVMVSILLEYAWTICVLICLEGIFSADSELVSAVIAKHLPH